MDSFRLFHNLFKLVAEREGFEPSIGVKAYTPLAGERLQPLGHLSGEGILYWKYFLQGFSNMILIYDFKVMSYRGSFTKHD